MTDYAICRRRFLAAGAACTFFGSGNPANAQYAEAATAIFTAVKAAIAQAQQASFEKHTSSALDEINLKLDAVIRNEQVIFDALTKINVAVGDLPQNLALQRLNAEKDGFDQLVADRFNRSSDELASWYNSIQITTSELGQNNFAAFPAFCSGVTMVTILARMIKRKSSLPLLYKHFIPYLQSWLDPAASEEKSIVTLIANTKRAIQSEVDAINGPHANTHHHYESYHSGDLTCHNEFQVSISGGLSQQFAGSLVEVEGECRQRPHRDPTSWDGSRPRLIKIANYTSATLTQPDPSRGPLEYPTLPALDVQTDWADVNAWVARKNAVIGRMRDVNQYGAMRDAIKDVIVFLGGPRSAGTDQPRQ